MCLTCHHTALAGAEWNTMWIRHCLEKQNKMCFTCKNFRFNLHLNCLAEQEGKSVEHSSQYLPILTPGGSANT